MPFASTHSFAKDKVDELLSILDYATFVNETIENIKPAPLSSVNADENSQLGNLIASHNKESAYLFEKHFNSDFIYSDLKKAFLETYTKAEIDAFYDFSKSKHGNSFLKKQYSINEKVRSTLSSLVNEYYEDLNALNKNHQKEIDRLIEETENRKQPKTEEKDKKLTIADFVRFSVHRENNEMRGYRVRPGTHTNLFDASPFETNDIIIAINGNELVDPKTIREMYNLIKTSDSVLFEVKREGKIIDFVIELYDYQKLLEEKDQTKQE